mmetsp:Transcript_133670/g.243758  ORF Transcript_133670/g.243758 Transcript_133670/m.243758 type:complete len:597 (+) Transcript_133670:78-1868(+)
MQSFPTPQLPAKSALRTSQTFIEANRTPCQRLAKRVIQNPFFESVMAIIIVLNFAMIIVEADSTAERANGENPDAPEWIEVCGWLVLILFVIELTLRVYVERVPFFADGWNKFDFFIISLDTLASLLGLIFGGAFPVSTLRILRLCKLARMSKIFRIFPELRLMMAGIIGSMRSIFWGMILLIFCLLIWAVIGVQFIHPLNLKITEKEVYLREDCKRCPHAYASVSYAVLTLLRESVAGDSWGKMTVPIIEEFPIAGLYFVGVMMTVSMAVLNLILGVVVNVAMQSRDDLAEQLAKEKVIHRVEVETNLSEICNAMDKDGSGELSKAELFGAYKENDAFRATLEELDIQEDDLEILWAVLDPDRDGQVPYDTFIHKSASMKESDMQFMLAYIKCYVTRIRDQVLQSQQQLKEYFLSGNSSALENFPLKASKSKQVDESSIHLKSLTGDLGSDGQQNAAGGTVKDQSDVSLHLSEDDRKILYDMSEKSQQWRDQLTTRIAGVDAKLDSILNRAQDAVLRDSARLEARPLHAPRSLFPSCQSEMAQPGMEAVVGKARVSLDDVVEPVSMPSAGGSRNSPHPYPEAPLDTLLPGAYPSG